MGNNHLPLQMQYLGSKARISGWIVDEAKRIFPGINKFFDIFSGTGSVAIEALGRGYEVSVNDFEKYSFCILQSLFALPKVGLDSLINRLSILKDDSKLLSRRKFMSELLEQERHFFSLADSKEFPWKSYKEFCDNTPLVDGSKVEINMLRQERKWNLFSHYYANTYFGIKQCLQLDALREFAEDHEASLKVHLLAATIASMTFGVSSTTHLAQYLRPYSKISALHLVKRRQYDFISEVIKRLIKLRNFDLSNNKANVYNLDYISALQQEDLNEGWIVYVDPPYFKEHYSRYYHILNTFYLYDYPYLTYNPVIKRVTQGRYRLERNVSDFGKKSSVRKAFSSLFSLCKEKNFRLVLSYAETSLVNKGILLEIAENNNLTPIISEKKLMHSSQGKYSNKLVTEYLFSFHPR